MEKAEVEAEVVAVEEAAASAGTGAEVTEMTESLVTAAGFSSNRSCRRGGAAPVVAATAVVVTVEAATVAVAAGVAEKSGSTARR